MEQQDEVDVVSVPSDSECNMGNETGAPLVFCPGLRGRASRCGRGRSSTTRTQARPTEQKDKVDVCFWPHNTECSMENETGAPLVIGPGRRGRASRRGRGATCGTRAQTRTVDQSNQVNVCFSPPNLECNMGNETGAPLGIESGLRGHANHPGRGHCCATRTQAREHSEALPALGSERKVHGALLKRRQVRLLRTTRAVAGKPLCQGKKSSAKARGHTENENTVSQPEVLPLTSPQEESSQGPPFLCWPPAFSPAPYMTTTLGQRLIALPSMVVHEAFAVSDPCTDLTPLPCSSMEYHPPEPQGPVAPDQASVSATFECEEILEAAAALMTLKNSSWTWRQTHS